MKKKLYNAIYWFDMMVHNFGLECETSTFIHNILSNILTNTMVDGCMIWDDEMIKKMYPQAIDQIKQEQLDKILGIIRYDVADFIKGRLKDGK